MPSSLFFDHLQQSSRAIINHKAKKAQIGIPIAAKPRAPLSLLACLFLVWERATSGPQHKTKDVHGGGEIRIADRSGDGVQYVIYLTSGSWGSTGDSPTGGINYSSFNLSLSSMLILVTLRGVVLLKLTPPHCQYW